MPLPTFLVIGAAKSGTTALYAYIGQHPEVYMPPKKEPSWFSFDGQQVNFTVPHGKVASDWPGFITDRSSYEALFSLAPASQMRGDVSPAYLYWPGTAERVAAEVPDMQIVAVLRHPVDRAYSAFMHARREGREPLHEFRDALDAEPARIGANCGLMWRYREQGRNSLQLRRWQRLFPADQMLLMTYEELATDPTGTCQRIQEFIGVDPVFAPNTTMRHNVSGVPRSRWAYDILGPHSLVGRAARHVTPGAWVEAIKGSQSRLRNRLLRTTPLSEDLRMELTGQWRSEIEELGDQTDLDLTGWLLPADHLGGVS